MDDTWIYCNKCKGPISVNFLLYSLSFCYILKRTMYGLLVFLEV